MGCRGSTLSRPGRDLRVFIPGTRKQGTFRGDSVRPRPSPRPWQREYQPGLSRETGPTEPWVGLASRKELEIGSRGLDAGSPEVCRAGWTPGQDLVFQPRREGLSPCGICVWVCRPSPDGWARTYCGGLSAYLEPLAVGVHRVFNLKTLS